MDIIEGVHEQTTNLMAGHTSDGCTIANTGFSGSLQASNCYVSAPNQASNAGCGISASSAQSYGAGFNSAGGGVYATEWTSSAISIWFWPRNAIPGDVSGGNPNPAGWGTPVAKFTGGCDIDAKFKDMQIVWIFLFFLLFIHIYSLHSYTPLPPPLIHGKNIEKKRKERKRKKQLMLIPSIDLRHYLLRRLGRLRLELGIVRLQSRLLLGFRR